MPLSTILCEVQLKKTSQTMIRWHKKRAANQAKRTMRTSSGPTASRRKIQRARSTICMAWQGDEFFDVVCTEGPRFPPPVLCLQSAQNETLTFLDELSARLAVKLDNGVPVKTRWWLRERDGRKLARVRTYVSFAQVERISPATAIVMAAEYDNARRLMNSIPPTINIHEWSDAAFKTLYELGFFQVLGITEETPQSKYRDIDEGKSRVMAICSGQNSNELELVSKQIIEFVSDLGINSKLPEDIELALNSALGEAMINVSRHAYNLAYFQPSQALTERWWCSASFDRAERSLKVILYDQGATIPRTLPKKDFWSKIKERFFEFVGSTEPRDFDFIAFALREGVTSSEKAGHGRGLPQMKDLIDICQAGSLAVYSGEGFCRYTVKGLEKRAIPKHLKGTLLEWDIVLP